MRGLLLDHSTSSIRLVVNPEKMVIKEAQRTFTYLNLYGYHTDLVVCNRMLPGDINEGFFKGWKEAQDRYLNLIHESFDPIPILKAPLMHQEVVGLDSLRALGEHIFGPQDTGSDPTRVLYEGLTQEFTSVDGQHVLTLRLPFTGAGDISVIENRDELILQVGQYRRNIILPRALARLEVADASMEGDIFRIIFRHK